MVNEIRNAEDLEKAELLPGDLISVHHGPHLVEYGTFEGQVVTSDGFTAGVAMKRFDRIYNLIQELFSEKPIFESLDSFIVVEERCVPIATD